MAPVLLLVAALTAPAAAAAAAQRIAIDFGHGWRYRVGDDPKGPGIGAFDIASGFEHASNCTGMVEKQLYHPAGNKNAGQRFTDCAVACSYDASCTAYRDQRLTSGQHCQNGVCCWHGTAATRCSGSGPPPPPPPPRGACTAGLEGHNYGRGGTQHALKTGDARACCSICASDPTCGCWDLDTNTSAPHLCYTKSDCSGPPLKEKHRVSGLLPGAANLGSNTRLKKKSAAFFRAYDYATEGFEATAGGGWRSASLPHDALINGTFAPANGEGSAFLPRPVVWYVLSLLDAGCQQYRMVLEYLSRYGIR